MGKRSVVLIHESWKLTALQTALVKFYIKICQITPPKSHQLLKLAALASYCSQAKAHMAYFWPQ